MTCCAASRIFWIFASESPLTASRSLLGVISSALAVWYPPSASFFRSAAATPAACSALSSVYVCAYSSSSAPSFPATAPAASFTSVASSAIAAICPSTSPSVGVPARE